MKNKIRFLILSILILPLSSIVSAQHFTPVWEGNNPQFFTNIIFSNIESDGVGLEAGDEIATFDTVGGVQVCVGVEVLLQGFTYPITLEAGMDDGNGGATAGNEIIYRIWDNSELMEITYTDPDYNYVPGTFDTVYGDAETVLVDLLSGLSNTWTGDTDNSWDDASNWNAPVVPNDIAYVKIPVFPSSGNFPTLSLSGECENLQMKSDATGNASILGNNNLTVHGSSIVYIYLEGYNSGAPNGWHNISSPVDNMSIAGSDFDFQTSDGNDLYQWDEPSSMWENYKGTNTFPNFENGRGYLCAFETTGTLGFVGTLNESDVTENNLTDIDGGWHLRGNPFASSIEWNNGGDWVTTGIAATAKIWDEFGGTYIDIISGDIIPSTNGFFVEVANATNTLTIPVSARVHDGSTNYKKTGENELPETLVLTITNDENTYYDVNRVGFKAEATEDWDYQFDSHKLFGEETAPQLWTLTNDDIFSLNYLPHAEGPYQVQLNFRPGVDATYFLNADGLESFYNNTEIFLEDMLTENLINLNEQQDYEFSASTGDNEERFILHFNGVTGIGEEISDNDINIYAHNNTVYIHFKEMPKEASRIDIFNIVGQKVYAGSIEPANLSKINIRENRGVYIVKLKTGDKWITQKVTINQ